jgi:predicted RNase H-like HicB family nuclease
MNPNSLTLTPSNLPKLAYSVLIEQENENSYKATVWGLPDCKAFGTTREQAIANARQLLVARLANAEIVSLEIENPHFEHPWMKFAGKYKDDPQFDEMLEDINALRRERDAQMEAYYRQLDAETEAR